MWIDLLCMHAFSYQHKLLVLIGCNTTKMSLDRFGCHLLLLCACVGFIKVFIIWQIYLKHDVFKG
jgi:hypothetical protein